MDERGDLADRVGALRAHYDTIASSRAQPEDLHLMEQVGSLAEWLDGAREDLSMLGAGSIVEHQIPAATNELEAVTIHTEAATTRILYECEALERAMDGTTCHPAVSVAVARVYEACSFQDITAQRIAKVVQTLRLLETHLSHIVRIVGYVPLPEPSPGEQRGLLNGPQQSHEHGVLGCLRQIVYDIAVRRHRVAIDQHRCRRHTFLAERR